MIHVLYGSWDTQPAMELITRFQNPVADSYLWFVPTGALSKLRASQGLQVHRTEPFLASRTHLSREANIRHSALQAAALHNIRRQLARSGSLARAATRRSFSEVLYESFQRFQMSLMSQEDIQHAFQGAGSDVESLSAPYGVYLERIARVPGWGGAGVQAVRELRKRSALPDWLGQPTVAVFEGYTYLTPVQEEFIRALDNCGVVVYLVITYDMDQQTLFEGVERTYERLVAKTAWQCTGITPVDKQPVLRQIGASLFSLDVGRSVMMEPTSPPDLEVHEFLTDEQELNAVAKRIRTLLDQGTRPGDIAIISRVPTHYEAALTRILADHDVPADLAEPPLADTPPGDLIRRMYDLEGRMFTFGTLLMLYNSGWVGDGDQADLLAQLQYYLLTLNTWEQIDTTLSHLQAVQSADIPMYHPLGRGGGNTLTELRSTIRSLYHWSLQALSPEARPVSAHLNILRQSLTDLGTWRRLEQLPRVRSRLESLLDAAEGNELLSGPEFALYIRKLLAEWDRRDDGTEPNAGRVSVMSPEQAENVNFSAVFVIGCVASAFPQPMPEVWPFTVPHLKRLARICRVHRMPDRTSHLALERYWFGVAVTRATKRLWLSYAIGEERDPQIATPFLGDLLDAVGLPEQVIARHGLTPWFDEERTPYTPEGTLGLLLEGNNWATELPAGPEQHLQAWVLAKDASDAIDHKRMAAPRRLNGADLFLLKVCPHRYHLERNLEMVQPFFHRFHLEHLAATQWLQAIMRQCANWGADRQVARKETRVSIELLYRDLGAASWDNIERAVLRLEPEWRFVEPRQYERYVTKVNGIEIVLDPDTVSATFTAPGDAALAFPAPITVRGMAQAREWYRELVELIIDNETDPARIVNHLEPVVQPVLDGSYRRVRDEEGHCSYCPHQVSCFMSRGQEGSQHGADTDSTSGTGD